MSSAASPVTTAVAEDSSPQASTGAEEDVVISRVTAATEAAPNSQVAALAQKAASPEMESSPEEVSLQATLPAETLAEVISQVSQSSEVPSVFVSSHE